MSRGLTAPILTVLLLLSIPLWGCSSRTGAPEVDPQVQAAAADTADYGPLPGDWRSRVESYASNLFSREYGQYLSWAVYVDSVAPVKRKLDDKVWGWSGRLAVRYEREYYDESGNSTTMEEYDIFDFYLRDGGAFLRVAKVDNEAAELGKSLLALGTLGLSTLAVDSDSSVGKAIAQRASRLNEMERQENIYRYADKPFTLPRSSFQISRHLFSEGQGVQILCRHESEIMIYDVQFNRGRMVNDFTEARSTGMGDTFDVRSDDTQSTLLEVRIVTSYGSLTEKMMP